MGSGGSLVFHIKELIVLRLHIFLHVKIRGMCVGLFCQQLFFFFCLGRVIIFITSQSRVSCTKAISHTKGAGRGAGGCIGFIGILGGGAGAKMAGKRMVAR